MSKILDGCRPLLVGKTAVTVALSGGGDSVACLHILLKLSEELGFSVGCAHFHHQIRGEEADRDADFCRRLCQAWNVPLTMGTGDVPARAKATGESLEEAARQLRYQFFQGLGTSVATAHTADDNLETLLLNLLRGTGLRGLCGIPPARDYLIRPILHMTKEDISAYLTENNLPFMVDSTNFEGIALRNRLRSDVLPKLQVEQPSLAVKTLEMTARLREDEDFLNRLAMEHLARAQRDGWLDVPTLLKAEPPILHRILRYFLQENQVYHVRAQHILNFEGLLRCEKPSAVVKFPNLTLRREYHKLLVGKPPNYTLEPRDVTPPFRVELPQGGWLICSENIPKQMKYLRINREKLGIFCTIRPRLIGDSLQLPGGTKTVKALMIDRKIPVTLRNCIPVLACGDQVVAVMELGVNVLFRPTNKENTLYLYIER
ncbi:MAG: tRNA lysidine(34) synthetase TilS [Eubacteriales bacterium]